MNFKHYLYALGLGIVAVFLVLNTNQILNSHQLLNTSQLALIPSVKSLTLTNIRDISTYKGLPVGEIKTYNTQNAWGTVIYVPQYHRSTGSNAEDKINDAGVFSQQQNYQILSFLIKDANIHLALVEGSPTGPLPSDKISALADKIQKRNNLVSSTEILEKVIEKDNIKTLLSQKLTKSLDGEISKIDREIILEGAVEKLKAEGQDIKVYGTENPSTNEEAKNVLRDYLFLQDRINQLNNSRTTNNNTTDLLKSTTGSPILQLLMNKTSSQPEFGLLETEALQQGKNDLAQQVNKTEDDYNNLEKNTPKTIMLTPSSDAPSWNDNPYKDVFDKQLLEDKFTQAKQKMEEVIVNQRNKDTAENMAQTLKNEHKSIGILQFGAGHEDGLIKELNKQGLSVIEIKSNEVVDQGQA